MTAMPTDKTAGPAPRGGNMTRKLDLAGQRFGRLLVIEASTTDANGKTRWSCLCDCGETSVVRTHSLRSGETSSCGCRMREVRGPESITHGMSHTPLYNVWSTMLSRTTNPCATSYPYYGARGISVCERWKTFENFYADMSAAYSPGLSIDRIDVNGNYEPGNCRWATATEQSRNQRTNRIIEWRGVRRVLAEWAELLGLDESAIRRRIKRGWAIERALTHGVSAERIAGAARHGRHMNIDLSSAGPNDLRDQS